MKAPTNHIGDAESWSYEANCDCYECRVLHFPGPEGVKRDRLYGQVRQGLSK